MAHEAIETFILSPWRARQIGVLMPEAVETTRWDKFLGELGLTEPEALDAILRNGEVGHSIRRFVEDCCRDHFIPEGVLRALSLQREAGKETPILPRTAPNQLRPSVNS